MASVKRSKPTAGKAKTKKATGAGASEAPVTAEVLQLSVAAGEAREDAGPKVYKMQDLMQEIASQSELKRKDLREAAGLVFEALGTALQDGRSVNFPGLGKITPRKRNERSNGDILTARIKLPAKGLDRSDALSGAAADSGTADEGEKA